jgi:hydroxyacylglutathione hydrolase
MTRQVSPQELSQQIHDGEFWSDDILDVRREGEWEAGHIGGVQCHALDSFARRLPELDPDRPVAVHCKSGYRSMIACSLLERAGYRNVINVVGGFDAWQAANLAVVVEQVAKG